LNRPAVESPNVAHSRLMLPPLVMSLETVNPSKVFNL
jgi:hypothetical protein